MKTAKDQGRQGDVMLVKVDPITGGVEIPRVNGRIVLKYGEGSGHAHVVTDPQIKWIEVEGEKYLQSDKPFLVRHENTDGTLTKNHDSIKFAAGTYLQVSQYEFERKPRPVID